MAGMGYLIHQLRAGEAIDVFKFVNDLLVSLQDAAKFGVEERRVGAFHNLIMFELLC